MSPERIHTIGASDMVSYLYSKTPHFRHQPMDTVRKRRSSTSKYQALLKSDETENRTKCVNSVGSGFGIIVDDSQPEIKQASASPKRASIIHT